MRVPTPTALAVTGLLAGTLLTAPGLTGAASAADLTTCQGKAVTRVVQGPGSWTGTPGDDVVVIDATTGPTGPYSLQTGAGDDTVCGYGSLPALFLDAGTGVDSIDTSAITPSSPTGEAQVRLGAGNDTYRGGPLRDTVTDEGPTGLASAPGLDDDTISTGDGDDTVTSYTGADSISTGDGRDGVLPTGRESVAVDLGAGDDTITVLQTPFSSLRGGDGTDKIITIGHGDADSIDNVQQTMDLTGTPVAFDSFESFDVLAPRALTFRGSDRAERLRVTGDLGAPASGTRTLVASMGGGDDELVVDQTVTGTWRGDAGHDLLTSDSSARASRGRQPGLVVDLLKGRFEAKGTASASIGAFERLATTRYPNVSVFGSKQADEVTLSTCRAFVDGRGGRDTIDVDDGRCGDKARSTTLRGGSGSDTITGGGGADTMYGGAGADVLRGRGGRDAAFGGPGRDRCTAERRVSC